MSNTGGLRVRGVSRGDFLANRVTNRLTAPFTNGQTVTLGAQMRWLRGERDVLLRVSGNYLEAAGRLLVPTNLGTPGRVNSRAVTNAGPAMTEVTHWPVLPAASQTVVVTARVYDPDGTTNVTLKYRLDPATTYSSVTMKDDGAGGDAHPGDGIFTGKIPGQAASQMVAFYLVATDATGATNRFPNDAPVRECLVRFGDPASPYSFGAYRFWLTQSNLNHWAARAQIDNTPIDATFVYGSNRVIYNAGLTYNGSDAHSKLYDSPSNRLCGYSVEIPSDGRFLGATELLVDWSMEDTTGQREQVAYWVANQMGLPFNHRRYVHVYVNGLWQRYRPNASQSLAVGVYEDAQEPGADLVAQWFPDEDAFELHKIAIWRTASWWDHTNGLVLNGGENHARLTTCTNAAGAKWLPRYRWNWRKRAVAASDSGHNYTNLYLLMDAANALKGTNALSAIEGQMDWEQWARILALERVVGNYDSYGYDYGQNMFAIRPDGLARWRLLLFDTESGFLVPPTSSVFGVDPNRGDPAITNLLQIPGIQRAFWRGFREAIDGPLLPQNCHPVIDGNYQALTNNAVRNSFNQSLHATNAQPIKDWIATRRGYLSNELAKLAAPFAIDNNGGNSFTVTHANAVTLFGRAPVSVANLRVNGASGNAAVAWSSLTNWSLSVGLPLPSVTTNTVQGYDRLNQLVTGAFDSIIMTNK